MTKNNSIPNFLNQKMCECLDMSIEFSHAFYESRFNKENHVDERVIEGLKSFLYLPVMVENLLHDYSLILEVERLSKLPQYSDLARQVLDKWVEKGLHSREYLTTDWQERRLKRSHGCDLQMSPSTKKSIIEVKPVPEIADHIVDGQQLKESDVHPIVEKHVSPISPAQPVKQHLTSPAPQRCQKIFKLMSESSISVDSKQRTTSPVFSGFPQRPILQAKRTAVLLDNDEAFDLLCRKKRSAPAAPKKRTELLKKEEIKTREHTAVKYQLGDKSPERERKPTLSTITVPEPKKIEEPKTKASLVAAPPPKIQLPADFVDLSSKKNRVAPVAPKRRIEENKISTVAPKSPTPDAPILLSPPAFDEMNKENHSPTVLPILTTSKQPGRHWNPLKNASKQQRNMLRGIIGKAPTVALVRKPTKEKKDDTKTSDALETAKKTTRKPSDPSKPKVDRKKKTNDDVTPSVSLASPSISSISSVFSPKQLLPCQIPKIQMPRYAPCKPISKST